VIYCFEPFQHWVEHFEQSIRRSMQRCLQYSVLVQNTVFSRTSKDRVKGIRSLRPSKLFGCHANV